MTEKEKCAAGMLYDANYDPDLLKDRNRCKDICFEYNNTKPSQLYEKKEQLKQLFGEVKGEFTIQAPFWCDHRRQCSDRCGKCCDKRYSSKRDRSWKSMPCAAANYRRTRIRHGKAGVS